MAIITILVAVIILNGLGFLWFSQLMFGKEWMRLTGHTMESIDSKGKVMAKSLSINVLLTIVTSFVLYAFLLAGFSITDMFATWAAFALPVFANDVLWDGKPWKLFFIKAGYSLVSLTIISQMIVWMI